MLKIGLTLNTNEVKVVFSNTEAIMTFNRIEVDGVEKAVFAKSTGTMHAFREELIMKEQPLSSEFKLTHVDNYVPNDKSIMILAAFALDYLGMKSDGDFAAMLQEHIDENEFQYRIA